MPDTSPRRLIVRCHGGLGNQIFQYAAGLYFAERTSVPIEIVRPHGAPDALRSKGFARPFQLDEFSLKAKIRPAGRVDRFYLSTKPIFRSMQSTFFGITRTQSIEEPSTNRFLPTLIDQVQARTIYLTGYWQAAAYAEAIADRLRASLQTAEPASPEEPALCRSNTRAEVPGVCAYSSGRLRATHRYRVEERRAGDLGFAQIVLPSGDRSHTNSASASRSGCLF